MGYICVHGHFYQPPREEPWLEAVEGQESAHPYHDWNERIAAECYAANVASPVLDSEGRVAKVINNYTRISFDFGPTLLSWLEENGPEVYRAILAADRQSQAAFSGHGSALAQAYNHIILPLANRRDKHTQVLWGRRDFEHRFQRPPEGMWLPETAVDLETLDTLAELGIRFTILSAHQAWRVRRIGSSVWREVSGRVDPTMAYELRLPSGRRINLFFYDGPISRGVALEGLLHQGEHFVHRLLSAFVEERAWPELVHIATDGETYGHHHPLGNMALAYALDHIVSHDLAQLTNYGEYLARHPPSHLVEIVENTSWSCAHGLERWKRDCGCKAGDHPEWNQGWRRPLREALDWLRDTLARNFDRLGRQVFKDPWAARNDYIDVILERSVERFERLLATHAAHRLDQREKVTALKMLEVQRHAMLMYTSCGWFFNELSGPETVQVIRHAARAVELAEESFGEALEADFLERLEEAKSNIEEHRDGRRTYERFVRPVAARFASARRAGSAGNRASFWKLLESVEADAARAASKPGGLVERLDRQVESLVSLGEAWSQRRAALEQALELLRRVDGWAGSDAGALAAAQGADDVDLVGGADRRLDGLGLLLVDEDLDVRADGLLLVDDAEAQAGVAPVKLPEQSGQRGAPRLDAAELRGIGSQRRGNVDSHRSATSTE